jgi:hypothetical protein
MSGRTTATLIAAALVGVLIPGIAAMSAGDARSSGEPASIVSATPPTDPIPTSPPARAPTAPTTAGTAASMPAPAEAPAPIPTAAHRVDAVASSTVPPPPTGPPIVTHRATIDVLAPQPVAAPVRVVVPALGIDGPVLAVGVNAMNELDVPPDARTLVWYRHGPTPGAAGSAVIAGHLDWRGTTGIFASLASTPVGETVTVTYEDGAQRQFVVRTVELVPKPAVGVHGVFARRGESVLRLVTCGGEFDDATNHYRSNVVVTATPA